MFGTNTVSHIIRDRLPKTPPMSTALQKICISTISEAELVFGMRRRQEARTLDKLIRNFIASIAIVAFDREAAERYAALRADMRRMGKIPTE
ncbi:MAG: PIN domain-containing protein [Rhizobiaceae bacterium]|nr:PIN domain-containing protein [Rhizobiaceae bacterium]